MKIKRLLSFILAFSLICGNVTGVSAAEANMSVSHNQVVIDGTGSIDIISQSETGETEGTASGHSTETEETESSEENETTEGESDSDNGIETGEESDSGSEKETEEETDSGSKKETGEESDSDSESDTEEENPDSGSEKETEEETDSGSEKETEGTLSDNNTETDMPGITVSANELPVGESVSANQLTAEGESSSVNESFSNIEIIQTQFGMGIISWSYPKEEKLMGFYIYCAKEDQETYTYLAEIGAAEGTEYETYISIPLDTATGNNQACNFKIVPVYYETGEEIWLEDGVEGIPSKIVSNKNISIGEGKENSEYVGICFLNEDGTEITELTIHVGESKKIGFGLKTADGTIVPVRSEEDIDKLYPDMDEGMSYSTHDWKVGYLNNEYISIDSSGNVLECPLTPETIEEFEAWFTARSVPEKTYYLELMTQVSLGYGYYMLRIPVTILPAEEGVTYEAAPTLVICENQTQAYQVARDKMVNRDSSYFVVKGGVFDQTTVLEWLDMDVVLDIFKERAGMKPEEGDYLSNTIGDPDDIRTLADFYDYHSFSYDGQQYDAYKITIPFITTRAQEDEVDDKIQKLIHEPTGELYQYKDASDTDKVRAIFDYIVKNVSGTVPGDRRTPIYHTTYHALMEGSGTCQAFATLFTRMTREMGVASKIIAGTDSAAHGYNIVRIDGKWYYIDTSAGIWLSTAKEFVRAPEQEVYKDQRFINNYLSQVVGSSYTYVPPGTVTVSNSEDAVTEGFDTLQEAKEYILEDGALAGNEAKTYTLTVNGKMTMSENSLNFGEYASRVEIDLGGNTLYLPDQGGAALICAKKISNGTFQIGYACHLEWLPMTGADSVSEYENLRVLWKQTESLIEYYDKIGSFQIGTYFSEETENGKIIVKDSVTVTGIMTVWVYSNVQVEADLKAKHLELDGAKSETEGDLVLRGTAVAEESCNITGEVTVHNLQSEKEARLSGSTITVTGELKLSGETSIISYLGKKHAYINLIREYNDGAVSPSRQGTISLKGAIITDYSQEKIVFEIQPVDYVNGVLKENTVFEVGDRIGYIGDVKISIGGNTTPVSISQNNFSEYFKCTITDQEGAFLELDEGTLQVAAMSVVAEGPDGSKAEFSSLKNAVAGLEALSGGANGTYTFYLSQNSALTKDLKLPAFVTRAVLKTAEAETEGIEGSKQSAAVTLDMMGNTLTIPEQLVLEEGVFLISSQEAGTLSFTKDTTKTAGQPISFIIKMASEEAVFVSTTGETISQAARAAILQNVNILASKAAVEFQSENTVPYILGSDVTADTIKVLSGNWKWNTASVTNLDIMSGAEVCIENVAKVTKLELQEQAVLAVDSYTQNSKGKTLLGANSIFALEGTAVMYNPVLVSGTETGNANIYKMPEAKLSIQGKVTKEAADGGISFGILKEKVSETRQISLQDISGQTEMFTTNIASFPLDMLQTKTALGETDTKYTVFYKIGNTIYAGAEWIVVKAIGVSGSTEKLQGFAKWSDAAAYLNTLSNTSMEYRVEITQDLDIKEELTLPSKVKKITFKGVPEDGEGKIELTYLGDIKLATDTSFENIDLKAQKYNSKTKQYDAYKSVVTLNGKAFSIENGTAEFASITGNKKDNVSFIDARVAVEKAVTNLGYLNMERAEISADNLTVINTLTMLSSEIECVTKFTLKDIVTEDAYNKLTYGGNTSKNILNITGSITSSDESDEVVSVRRTENSNEIKKDVRVRKNAIELIMISAKSGTSGGYKQDMLLCNAAKAGAGWFVIGTDWESVEDEDTRIIQFASYKRNNVIYCGETADNVTLYSSRTGEGNSYALESSFATLQEALSEIDKLAVSSNFYRIEMKNAEENVVSFSNKAITFPSKAAEVTIAPAASLTDAKIYFKGNLALKSNVVFEDVTFVPAAGTQVTLGNYSLTLTRCDVKGFTAITGSGVNKASALVLYDTALEVSGAVNNVGKLVFTGEAAEEQISTYSMRAVDHSSLCAEGNINVGTIELETEADLTGLATVTRKNGSITKIVPQITINGEVYSENGKTLYLDLREKVGDTFQQLKFDEAEQIKQAGIQLAKALTVTYPNIKAKQSGEEKLVKTSGYLTYYEDGVGVELSFTEEGKTTVILCHSFEDAVTEINNQKTKRDYTITLLEVITEISRTAPKALTMPNKNYISSLNIKAGSNSEDIQLGYLSNITFTSDVTLTDVHFVQMVKSGTGYQAVDMVKDDYPAAVTLNTGGYNLNLEGDITFNTPLVLNGGNKGKLEFTESGSLNTWTNGFDKADTEVENTIYGMITNFDTVNIQSCDVTLKEYETARDSKKFTASNTKGTTLKLIDGVLTVVGDHAKGSFTMKELYVENGKVIVGGKVNLTNVTLEGEQTPVIAADLDFNITGTLTSSSDTATLQTRLKGEGKAPYLNISGKVIREEDTKPIYVGVYPQVTAAIDIRDEAVKLTNAPKVTAQLLTAKTAAASDFRPIPANYTNDGGEYSLENQNGYMMLKSGSNIYVYEGGQVRVAVEKNGETAGYYPSINEATTAVNAIKDKTAEYTFILTQENGSIAAPISVALPAQAAKVTVKSADNTKNVYFSGNISLAADTVLENISLAPVNKGKGAAFNMVTNGYDLTVTDVTVSEELDKMALKDITGKGQSVITLNTADLQLTGSLTGAWELYVQENTEITGNLKATTLYLMNTENSKPVTLKAKGSVTVDAIRNSGSSQNILQYTRTNKNVTNLTINKDIINSDTENILLLEQLTTGSIVSGDMFALAKSGVRTTLSAGKKLAVMPKAATDSFEVSLVDATQTNKEKLDAENIVKADKGIYYIDDTLADNKVLLKQGDSITNCLDYTQAVNEINNRADIEADYTITFIIHDEAGMGEVDTNVTDNNQYSTFSMPKGNTKQSLTVEGMENGTTSIPFTGGITGYGKNTLKNLILNPVKGGSDATPVDVKITISADKTESAFILENVNTKVTTVENAKTTGFISTVSGVKNKTILTVKDCSNLIIKTGISNVQEAELANTSLLTGGASTVNKVILQEGGSWDSIGKLTVNEAEVLTTADTAYIGTKLDKNDIPQFVVNEDVTKGTLLCKVYTAGTTLADDEKIFAGADYGLAEAEEKKDRGPTEVKNYNGVKLVSAKKAEADNFRAYPFRVDVTTGELTANSEGITNDKLAVYKEGVYVKNGNLADMQVKITEHEGSKDGEIISTFYAKSLDAATTIINNKADMQSYYEIQLLVKESADGTPTDESGLQTVKTAKEGNDYGAFNLPSRAAGLTVSGAVDKDGQPSMVIKYTGTLKAGCDVTFQNIFLTEGKADKKATDGFAVNNSITPVPGTNVTMTFEETVKVTDSLVLSGVNASKGNLVLEGNQAVVNGNISVQSLSLTEGAKLEGNGNVNAKYITLTEGAALEAKGKLTVTGIYADDTQENTIASLSAMSIANIYKTEDASSNGTLKLKTCFTKITKAGQYGNAQLTISGIIEEAEVIIQPQRYDFSSKVYMDMAEADFQALLVTDDKKPAGYKKLLTMPKASLDAITVTDGSGISYTADTGHKLYKYETGVYLTNQSLAVTVTGYANRTENGMEAVYENPSYQTSFLTWDQAVKEIDKIGNNKAYYEIKLLSNIGYADGKITNPVANVAVPSKAAEITITTAVEGQEYGIFFTGASIAAKCNTRIEGVGFTRVKKVGSGLNTTYQPITYTLNTGSWQVAQIKVPASFAGVETIPYSVSGSKKGIFSYIPEQQATGQITKISGVENVILWNTEMSENAQSKTEYSITGGISGITNLTLNPGVTADCENAALSVKNIVLSHSKAMAKNITVSSQTTLEAGTLQAGTTAANDGKINLKDIIVKADGNCLAGKQDKNGNTQITVTGAIIEDALDGTLKEGAIEILLYYNNNRKPAQLYHGMVLCYAAKAPVAVFVPRYTVRTGEGQEVIQAGMGQENGQYGLYKAGKNICYGRITEG